MVTLTFNHLFNNFSLSYLLLSVLLWLLYNHYSFNIIFFFVSFIFDLFIVKDPESL